MFKKPTVTDTELAILEVLWSAGPSTTRDLVQAIYRRHNPSLHATINSLLDRLLEKGHILRDGSAFAHRYSPAITREKFVADNLQQLADRHFDGAVAPLLLALVDKISIKPKDRQALRKIIENIK